MDKDMKRELKMYYSAIERRLSCNKKEKKKLLLTLQQNVDHYLELDYASMEDIYSRFGTVDEIVDAFYQSNPPASVARKSEQRKNIIKIFLIVFVLAFLLVAGWFIYVVCNDAYTIVIETEILD